MKKSKIKKNISDFVISQGFDFVGFSSTHLESKYIKCFKDWLFEGNHADMKYLEKEDSREFLNNILPNSKSVICMAMNYYYEQGDLPKASFRVARYAYARNYHKVIEKKLKEIVCFLKEAFPDEDFKAYVDTGPVLERAFAEQAGIGQIGKNGCLISQSCGSWVFLAEIISTLDLEDEEASTKSIENKECKNFEFVNDISNNTVIGKAASENRYTEDTKNTSEYFKCASCTKCIEACPTGAIIAPGVVDARRCISYLTIEHRGEIDEDLLEIIKKEKRFFGCDICQEVCPQNIARQKIHNHPELSDNPIAGDCVAIEDIKNMKSELDYLEKFAGSPLMRPKLKGMKRFL